MRLGCVLLLAVSVVCATADAVPVKVTEADLTDPHRIFRFKKPGAKRFTYVNGYQRVPPTLREQAEMVDLKDVSLNEELSEDLAHAVDTFLSRYQEKLDAVLDSKHCRDRRERADAGLWGVLQGEYGGLLVMALLALLLVVTTPLITKKLGLTNWGRIVAFVVPVLLTAGLISWGVAAGMERLREVTRQAEPCRKEAYATPAVTPQSKARRRNLLHRLHGQLESSYGTRARDLDAILGEAR